MISSSRAGGGMGVGWYRHPEVGFGSRCDTVRVLSVGAEARVVFCCLLVCPPQGGVYICG